MYCYKPTPFTSYTPYMPYMPYMPYDMYGTAGKEYMYGTEFSSEPMSMDCMKSFFMPKGKEMKCVKVPEVIGKNHCQVLLETEIPFAPGCPAIEIKDILKEVKELIFSVCKDKVLINGKLHKNINYKTLENISKLKCNCNDLDLVYGDLKHVSVWIPFSSFIEVPGALPGDEVEVEFAGVEDACELDILMEPYYIKSCHIPVYKKLKEKTIVKIVVKVLRPVQITVGPETPNLCP